MFPTLFSTFFHRNAKFEPVTLRHFTDSNLSVMLHSPHLYSSHHHHHLHFIIPNSCYLTSFSFSSLSILPFHLHILFITICNSTLSLFRPFAISVLRFLPSIPILPTAPCAREYCRLCPSDGRKRHSPFRAYVNPQNGIWKSGPEQESV